eukprot:9477189-Pyramimonas_sp.AAC.1
MEVPGGVKVPGCIAARSLLLDVNDRRALVGLAPHLWLALGSKCKLSLASYSIRKKSEEDELDDGRTMRRTMRRPHRKPDVYAHAV